MTPKCFRRINIGTRTMRMVILIAILIIHFCKGCHVTHYSFLKQQQKSFYLSFGAGPGGWLCYANDTITFWTTVFKFSEM